MVRLLKKLLIYFFDLLYIVMFAFAIGFVKHFRFDCSVIDFIVATILYTALRFYLHKKKYERFSQKFSLQVVLLWLYLFLLLALPTAFVWAKKTFPVQNPDLTIMTLQMPVDGFVSVFIQDFFSRVGFYALVLSLSLLWPICDLYQNLKFRKVFFAIAFIVIFIAGSFPFWNAISPKARRQYIDYYFNSPAEPAHSKFYQDKFVLYAPEMVSADDTTRNLVFIYVEAFENTFLKFTPEISQLYKQGLVFSDKFPYGGGKNIIGAATTISSMVSKTTGMPLLCGSSVMNNFGKTGETFFDSLPGIYDILHQFGYRNFYVQGTPARFGATGPFFLAHGIDELYDKDDIEKALEAKGETYRRRGPGVADADVFDYAKSILDTLGHTPFSMTVTTIDTHFPRGFLDRRCKIKPANSSDGAYYAAVLSCTSKRIGEFVKWIQEKPFGSNTEIVIAGDHLFMTKSPFPVSKQSDRRFVNIYINPKKSSAQTRRKYTSFDSAPTVLETMGFNLEGHRLGFGASLLPDEKTLVESMKERQLVHLLRELSGSIEYNALFQSKAP